MSSNFERFYKNKEHSCLLKGKKKHGDVFDITNAQRLNTKWREK